MVSRSQFISLLGVFAFVCTGYIAPQDRRYLDYFLKLYSAKLFQKNNCTLISSSAIVSKKSIEKVEMVLSFYRVLPRDQARELLVSVAEALVDAINNDQELIKRGLISRPFTAEQLSLEIRTDNLYSANADVESIRRIQLKSGVITYDRYLWSSILSAGSESFSEEYQYAMMLVGLPTTYDPRARAEKYRAQHPELASFDGVMSAGELAEYKNPELSQRVPRQKPQPPPPPKNVMVSFSNALEIQPEERSSTFNNLDGNIEWIDSKINKREPEGLGVGFASQPVAPPVVPLESSIQESTTIPHTPAEAAKGQSKDSSPIEEATSAIDKLFPTTKAASASGRTLRDRVLNDTQRVWKDGAQSPASFKSPHVPSQLIPIQEPAQGVEESVDSSNNPQSSAVTGKEMSYFFKQGDGVPGCKSMKDGLFENTASSCDGFARQQTAQKEKFDSVTSVAFLEQPVASGSDKVGSAPLSWKQVPPSSGDLDSMKRVARVRCEELRGPLQDQEIQSTSSEWKYLAMTSSDEGITSPQAAQISHSVYPEQKEDVKRLLSCASEGVSANFESGFDAGFDHGFIANTTLKKGWGYMPADLVQGDSCPTRKQSISHVIYPVNNGQRVSHVAAGDEGAGESFEQKIAVTVPGAAAVRDWGYRPIASKDALIAEVEPEETVQDDPEMPSDDTEHEPTGFSDLSQYFSLGSSINAPQQLSKKLKGRRGVNENQFVAHAGELQAPEESNSQIEENVEENQVTSPVTSQEQSNFWKRIKEWWQS